MVRRLSTTALAGGILGASALIFGAGPAFADHPHNVRTPNGGCHEVAAGQTGIGDPGHGGHHRFHLNVHWGATEDDNDAVLGQGNSRVEIVLDC